MKKLFYGILFLAFVSCSSGNKNVNNEGTQEKTENAQIVEATINVGGMHCDMCVASVTKGVNELEGITSVKVSLEDSTAVVSFQPDKVELASIEKAIEKRGYTIKSKE